MRSSDVRIVSVIRPYGTSMIQQYESLFDEQTDPSEKIERAHLAETSEMIGELITETAKILKLRLFLCEYDLHQGMNVPMQKSRALIMESNMVAMINPQNEQLSFIMSCMRENPTMSALLTYTNKDYENEVLERNYENIGTEQIYLYTEPPTKERRIFVSPLKREEEEKIIPVLKKALMYPYKAA